ncbi:hypothetical protein PIB30_105904, partial [Stylosanthes scabra]|nr:hypothetical protein [Stylosanthes scabra]
LKLYVNDLIVIIDVMKNDAWQGWWFRPACSRLMKVYGDDGFVPPIVRTVAWSCSQDDENGHREDGDTLRSLVDHKSTATVGTAIRNAHCWTGKMTFS